MNVFVCDYDPIVAAKSLADKHVVKMVVETTQLLSTACHLQNISFEGQYKATHKHHPCLIALLEQPAFLQWTIAHGVALCHEYTERYQREHKSEQIMAYAAKHLQTDHCIVMSDFDTFPRAVFDEFKTLPVVDAYRAHLRKKYNVLWKPGNARWKFPSVNPLWLEK